MRRSIALASVCALALATALFAGAAVAGNGNGNGNGTESAPGQVKQEQAAQPAQPAAQQSAPGQVKKASTPAPAKKTSSSHGVNSTQAGVKPSSTTSKWTKTKVGASPDVSKRYGNGKTAAQIAKSRGASDDVDLTGPGNSQPHKVAVCPKDANKSGGVDVHAVKSYDTANCEQAVTQPQQSVTEQRVCGAVITTTHTEQVLGVMHHDHLMTNPKSAHFTKHGDKQVVVEQSVTQVTPTGEVCNQEQQQTVVQQQQQQQSILQQQAVSPVQVQALPATQGLPPTVSAFAATPAQGGVLGAQASLAQPKAKAKGGVLGTVGNVAGASLPFTGFPIWAAVLIALALVASGLVLRRRGRPYSPRL